MEDVVSFTVVLAGDSGTGKSALITRMEKDDFVDSPKSGLSGKMIPIIVDDVNGQTVRLMVWDTPGSDDYRFLAAGQFVDAQAVVLVYSVDDLESLNSISGPWRSLVEESSAVPHITLLVGNKIDVEEVKRTVRNEEADKVSAELNAENFFVSAKDGCGVGELVRVIAHKLVEKFPVAEKRLAERPIEDAPELKRPKKRRHSENAVTCQCILI